MQSKNTKNYTRDDLTSFEQKVQVLWEDGELPYLMHLSGGNEDFLIDLFNHDIKINDWVLSTHRNHYHALLSGFTHEELLDGIKEGRSMFTYSNALKFLTSSILAGQCCIAAGLAWSLKESGSNNRVWCFLGDGAEEQGHFYEAVLMVSGNDLPCTFVIEDNDRSVDTTIEERLVNKTRMEWPSCVVRNKYTPVFPHAGNGTKKMIKFKDAKK